MAAVMTSRTAGDITAGLLSNLITKQTSDSYSASTKTYLYQFTTKSQTKLFLT